ncbi:MAG: thiopurine S-methyltransferase [Thermomonas sp.]|uniref:thiopurine S-methyltransferase n=1 Tax=Thermomonas sp. TaxID=1971895 RepID=UPI00262D69C5|nr:thiopurine S-methyltransferase [Thermomonas sp.]MCC7095638.1 thiopurine S-methyltransferase [Thermomonas sp.]
MQPDFWHQRWQHQQIGFHQGEPTALLQKHWPALGIATSAKVFVPLAGKSLDMVWLAARGHRVLAVELSQLAIDAFFSEHLLEPQVHASRHGLHHVAGNIEIIRGDVFDLDAAALADCSAVFDRAAVIALPPEMRQRYARTPYSLLPEGCRGLMITLEYSQDERPGPPFSVPESEIRALFEPFWEIQPLERRPIPSEHPGHVTGTSALDTVVYGLVRGRIRD